GGGCMSSTQKALKDGLLLDEVVTDDGEKQLSFSNTTVDKQFICKYGFKGGEPTALGNTRTEAGKWIVSIHPGETQLFVKGKWSGLTKSIATGPCAKEWLEKQADTAKDANARELANVKEQISKAKLKEPSSEEVALLCEKNGIPFIDTNFLPLDGSLQFSWQKGEMKMYPFKRATQWELLKEANLEPQLFVSRIEPADVNQGALADCYLMGALGSVASNEKFVKRLFCENQKPSLGIYRVNVCKNAWWRTVVVDDFMPCSGPKPAFARNRDEPNELWVALVEKAYAKVNGSYFAMKTGQCAAALADLTGCPYKTLPMSADIWDTLLAQSTAGILQVFGTPGKNLMYVDASTQSEEDKAMWEKYRAVELICEHSYSVLRCLVTKSGTKLCKLRNPWGTTNHGLWTGKWCVAPTIDPDWTPKLKEEVGWDESDGVFWMSWEDCTQWFNSVSIGYTMENWESVRVAGSWQSGTPTVSVELEVKAATQVWVGLHQSDTRGIKPGSGPDASYVNMNLFVVAPKKGDGAKVVESFGTGKRDRFGLLNLDPAVSAKLLVVGMPKESTTTKDFVLSFLIEKIDAVEMRFLSPASAGHASAAKDIVFSQWEPADHSFQVEGPALSARKIIEKRGKQLSSAVLDTKKSNSVQNGSAANVKESHLPAATTASNTAPAATTTAAEPVATATTSDAPSTTAEPATTGITAAIATSVTTPTLPVDNDKEKQKATQEQPSPSPPPKTTAALDATPAARVRSGSGGPVAKKEPKAAVRSKTTLPTKAAEKAQPKAGKKAPKKTEELVVEVEISSAAGLSSKGSQNPFCEIKLRTVVDGVVGSDHPSPQKQSTKVVNKNLSPMWNEKFRFTVPSADCIRISIFGKKMMGKDYLGRVDILAEDMLKLETGASPAKTTYTIQGQDEGRGPVSGTMDIALKRLK
ncbi:Calpain-D, partial [Diplonema papillatum]